MKTTVLSCLLCLSCLLSACHSRQQSASPSQAEKAQLQEEAYRQAIVSVFRQHDAAKDHTVAELDGKVIEADWPRFVALLRQINYTACPDDFRVAWIAYVQSLKPVQDNTDTRAIGHILADTTLTTPFRGLGKAILEDNPPVSKEPTVVDRLELVCAKYGVQLQRR